VRAGNEHGFVPNAKHVFLCKKNTADAHNVHNIPFGEDLLKNDLKDIVDSERSKYDGYKIDDMAKAMGRPVLRLPPYHCELNPYELVWEQIKHNVGVNNTQFETNLMDKLIHEGFGHVTVENWRNYVRHVKEIEAKMWRADEIQDNIDPLIINLGDDSSSAESSPSEESGDDDDAMGSIQPLP
jgi:transposase